VIRRLLRALRCWNQGCPVWVVSGWHEGRLWMGCQCNDCGRVSHYAPTNQFCTGVGPKPRSALHGLNR
jgi:hypothetical protein